MVNVFIPFEQRKVHRELDSGDFVRIQGKWYIIDEIRRWRRRFTYAFDDADLDVQLPQLTGSLSKRFQHIDKIAIDPDATCPTVEVTIFKWGTDVTGLQYGHTFQQYNANRLGPYELNNNSFSTEDIIRIVIAFGVGETGNVNIWFSGEEYTLVDYKPGEPTRFVIVLPYGFSRVMTLKEFTDSGMAASLRT